MDKKLFRVILLLMVLSMLSGIIVSCTVFSPIVGKWQDNSGNTYEFTRTGNVIINANNYVITGTWSTVSSNVITLNMQGDAGSMFNMLAGNSWQYTISGDTMTVDAGGSTNYLYRFQNPTTSKVIQTTTTNAPKITVTYPKGGETFNAGQVINITWKSTNLSKNDTIDIDFDYYNGGHFDITGTNGVPNSGSYKWTIPNPNTLKENQGSISILKWDGVYITVAGGSGRFTITN
jgi:hypothetical protein